MKLCLWNPFWGIVVTNYTESIRLIKAFCISLAFSVLPKVSFKHNYFIGKTWVVNRGWHFSCSESTMHLNVTSCFDRKIDRKLSCLKWCLVDTKHGFWRKCVCITYKKKKFEDIKQMQATILPDIGINESLKICYNLPHKFCTTWPVVMMASFGVLQNVVIISSARLYTWFWTLVLCRLNPIDWIFPKSITFWNSPCAICPTACYY